MAIVATIFCKRLLQQHGDDIRTAEDILELMRTKVTNYEGESPQVHAI